MSTRKAVAIREGLWKTLPGEAPRLIGSRCRNCGEVYFPRKDKGICLNCQKRELEEVLLSRTGKIYSFTTVMQRPPIYYTGPVPYSLAWIELPDGVRFESLLTGVDSTKLKIGMPVELVIEKIREDEAGNDVVTYMFRPISAGGR